VIDTALEACAGDSRYPRRVHLQGRHVSLRTVLPEDGAVLASILAEPAVSRWWPSHDRDRVETELLVRQPDTEVFAIEAEGRVVGAIQAREESEPEFRHAGIDIFLGSDVHGRGWGPDAIRTLAAHLIDDCGHHRLTIDPAADNEVAIRAYGKVGFRPVGRLRQYQRMADGSWVDALLMELLADELVR
jgi:aminoglycoside 6'-N-acetyltransferase